MWRISTEVFERLLTQYSAKEISEKTGYSRQIIYNWRRGNTVPSTAAILKICNSLDINPAFFFDYSEVKSLDNPPVDGEGMSKELDMETQYFFEIDGWPFSLTPLDKGVIEMNTYDIDSEAYGGFTVKEKIKIKIK